MPDVADITIFIPVKNGANFIETAILSVISQTFSNWKLIVRDNCSTDNTESIVAKYLGDKRIVWESNSSDLGSIGNYNSCLENILSRYYLILSHDDYLYSNSALAAAFDVLEQYPDIVKVHSDMMFVDGNGNNIIRRRFPWRGIVESDFVARKSIISVRNLYGIPLLIRTSAVQQHRYCEAYPHSCDVDFSIAIGRNKSIFFLTDVLIAIRFHSGNHTHRKFDTIANELRQSADKRGLKLGQIERLRQSFYDLYQRVAKTLFFRFYSLGK